MACYVSHRRLGAAVRYFQDKNDEAALLSRLLIYLHFSCSLTSREAQDRSPSAEFAKAEKLYPSLLFCVLCSPPLHHQPRKIQHLKMHDLMQSTTLGAILRIVSRGRIYGWEEYKNPALVELYLNNKNPPQPPLAPSTPSPKPPKSRRRRRALARHRHEPGQAQAPSPRSSKEEAEDEQPESEPESDSEEKKDQEKEERPEDFKEKDAADDASLSRNQQHPNLTPRSASALQDAEKGQDFVLIDWLENDPANPQNWSTPKKFFVTFQICLLTTSVYIGSAIYTAGLGGVVEQFHVSETAALLGLSLFVAGYGLGPMVWVSANP